MKPKTLIVLVAILAVLGGLVYTRQSQQAEVSIVDQVEMKPLVAEGITAEQIGKLIVYTGARPEKKVELLKTDKGWRTASYFNSPAASSKIDPYIASAIGVTGEFRATAPEGGLADYGLSEDTAFHIEGYEGDTKLFHVLVGKSPKPKAAFMRAEGSNEVYVTDASLKEDAGLFGDTEGMAASPDWWLDKAVLSMDTANVAAIDLTYPDKHLKFERREIPKPQQPVPAEGGEAAADAEAESAEPPAPPEYEWVVAEGGLDKTLKTAAIDQLLRKLGSLTATTIVDPAKKDEYSLNPPNFVAKISLADGTEKILNGGRPEPLKGTYLTLADDADNIVYNVSRFDFEDLFPFGSDLYDFESSGIVVDDVTRIEVKTPEFAASMVKEGEDWRIESPTLSLKGDVYKPRDMVSAAVGLTIKDYAVPGDHYGLANAIATVTLTKTDGSTYAVGRGIAGTSVDGYYVSMPGVDYPVAVENTQLNNVFVKISDLFDRTLFAGVDDESIAKIEIKRETDSLTLEDQEATWKVTAGDQTFNADFDTIDDYRFGLTVLEADAFEIVEGREPAKPDSVITMTMKDGTNHTLNIEGMKDGVYTATASGHPNLVFTIGSEAMGRVLQPADHFRPAPPEEGATAGGPAPISLENVLPQPGHGN